MERKLNCPKCGTENFSWRKRCQQCGEELHKDERKTPKFERRGAEFWFPFIMGLIGSTIFGFLLFFSITFVPQQKYLLFLVAFPVVGLSLSWKWPLVGGILLIITSLLILIFMIIAGITSSLLGIIFTILMFIPILISGIIFIYLRR